MHSILVADDSPQIRSLIRAFLDRPEFDVYEAVDGLDAVERAAQIEPDLIILDLSMPRMSGLDAGRVLRPRMRDVPFILFTAYGDAVAAGEVAAAGINALISKSDVVGLVAQVEALLDVPRPDKPPT